MAVYQECSSTEQSAKNTGANEQCLEGLFIRPALAIPGFSFDSIEDAKDIKKWIEAVALKQIIPLYDVEEFASANTEDTFFEGRNQKYRTALGKKVSTYSSFLSLCSHAALASYNDKDMQLFEFTEDGAIKAVITSDKKIKGQSVKLTIGKRLDATADRPPSTMVTINYKDYKEFEQNGAILRPNDWTSEDIYGIFDVHLNFVSATATNIVVEAATGCAGGDTPINTLESTSFVVRNLTGQAQTVTVSEGENGQYIITGTSFGTGFTVEIAGVVTIDELSYEGIDKVKIVVTPAP